MSDDSFDPEKLLNYFVTANEKIHKKINQNDIVLVIGNTGSGKSSLVNYLIGHEIEFIMDDHDSRPKVDVTEKIKRTREYAKVGHTLDRSQTLFPEGFVDKESSIIYCDCPGFLDNRDIEEVIAVNVNLELAIRNSKSVRAIIVVINYSELFASRGDSFKSLYKLLDDMIANLDRVSASIIYVITRCEQSYTEKNFTSYIEKLISSNDSFINDMKNKMISFGSMLKMDSKTKKQDKTIKEKERTVKIMSIIHENRNNIVIGNLRTKECRQRITEIIQKNQRISKGSFRFDSFDNNRVIFNEFINVEIFKGVKRLRTATILPDEIVNCIYEINECNSKIEFYKNEIKRFKDIIRNKSFEDVEEEINKYQEKIEQISANLKEVTLKIEDLNLEKKNLSKELISIGSEAPYLIKKWEYVDNRIKLFGALAKSDKKFKYSNPNTPILSIEKNCKNGSFKEESLKKERGYYKVTYQSERGKDGQASVNLYIRERDRIENRARESDLKDNLLAELDENLSRYNSVKNSYEVEIKNIEDSIRILKNQTIRSRANELENKINLFESNIKQHEKNRKDWEVYKGKCIDSLNKANEYISSKKTHLEIANFIIQSLGFTTTMSKEFSKYYQLFVSRGPIQSSDLIKKKVSSTASMASAFTNGSSEQTEGFFCPLSKKRMFDPYISITCGHSFEYEFVVKLIQSTPDAVCPIDKFPLEFENLRPNNELKKCIDEHLEKSFEVKQSITQFDDVNTDEEYLLAINEKANLENELGEIEKRKEFLIYALKELDRMIKKWENVKKTGGQINSSGQMKTIQSRNENQYQDERGNENFEIVCKLNLLSRDENSATERSSKDDPLPSSPPLPPPLPPKKPSGIEQNQFIDHQAKPVQMRAKLSEVKPQSKLNSLPPLIPARPTSLQVHSSAPLPPPLPSSLFQPSSSDTTIKTNFQQSVKNPIENESCPSPQTFLQDIKNFDLNRLKKSDSMQNKQGSKPISVASKSSINEIQGLLKVDIKKWIQQSSESSDPDVDDDSWND